MSWRWDADEPAAEAETPLVGGDFDPGAPPPVDSMPAGSGRRSLAVVDSFSPCCGPAVRGVAEFGASQVRSTQGHHRRWRLAAAGWCRLQR